jgi:hypothetical protein
MRLDIIFIMCLLPCMTLLPAGQGKMRVVGIHDPFTPLVAGLLHRNPEEAARKGDRLLLIEKVGLDPATIHRDSSPESTIPNASLFPHLV